MASLNNVPKEILESIRDTVDRRIKLSIKRLVNYETKKDKTEQRVVAFSPYRLFIFAAKAPTKVETNFHYLDIKSIESKKPNHIVITTVKTSYTFTSLDTETDEVNHMITHIGTSLKTIFPNFPLERLIKKVDVQPSDRLKVMYDMMKTIEQKETGPCGGFTSMYACMCDFHSLTYRDEVAWDVDTIYLSQDSRALCLRDFDHLKERDLVPIVSALVHNTWFTTLNANNVKLAPEVCNEILRVMKKNSVIEALLMSNTGINTEFVKKLSTTCMAEMQLHKLDLSNNAIDDIGAEHMFGALSSRGKRFTYLDMSKTKVTSKGLNRIAESMSKSPQVFSCLQTLKLAWLSSPKPEELQSLYSFLASPNMITELDLSGTDIELEKLVAPLQRGCSQNISVLKLGKTTFTNKRMKEVVVQASFKQFFSTVVTHKHLDLSGSKIPPEALKELLLGIGSNRNVSNIHVNISGVEIQGSQGAAVLQSCLPNIGNISSLNISGIVFGDPDLSSVLNSIGQNKGLKHLYLGRIFQNVKPKNMKNVMEELVHVIQDEDSVIETLSLADSKLKDSMNMIINALGSNSSLTELDISGNLMGDLGARMLSKALQINNKLTTIIWDKNNTSCVGFEDIADALEKNYTLRKMPIPVYDASVALRTNPDRTEQALQTIESLLQRNHSPQKYSSDQAYRLQQGFLISSTQQMVDRLVVQSEDTINALTIDNGEAYTNDIALTKSIVKDADNSKTLLPMLHDIAIQSENTGNPVNLKLKEIAAELRTVLESQMKETVAKMMEATHKHCDAVMKERAFVSDLQSGCSEKSAFPKDFTTNILTGVDTEIFNTVSEMNLAVAAHMSDRVIDEVIERLSSCHKILTNHLNQKKKDMGRRSQVNSQKLDVNTSNKGTPSPQAIKSRDASPKQAEKDFLRVPTENDKRDSPKVQNKRKSMHARKIRPQSVIDPEQVQLALVAADGQRPERPVTIPQGSKKSRGASKSPQPSRSPDPKPSKSPRKRKDKSGSPSKKPKEEPKQEPKIQIPDIQVSETPEAETTSKDGPIYDNVVFDKDFVKGQHGWERKSKDTLDDDDFSVPVKQPSPAKVDPEVGDFDEVPELAEIKPLSHVTKNRAKRAKQVRPTTRQSTLPTSPSVDDVDDGIDDFFTSSTSSITPSVQNVPDKGDKSSRSGSLSSEKSTPDTKKKKAGLFGLGQKDGNKENKEKDQKKSGGMLSGFLGRKSPKPSPPPASMKKTNRVSDIQEETVETKKSVTENSSQRESIDKKKEPNIEQSPAREKSIKKDLEKEETESIKSSKSSESASSLEKSTEETKDGSDKKKPLGLPKTKKTSLGDLKVSKTEEDEDVPDKKEEKDLDTKSTDTKSEKSEDEKDSDSKKDDNEAEKTQPDDSKAESDKEEDDADTKKADKAEETKPEGETEEEDKSEESPKPAVKKPMIPGGIGFGVNLMAEMKQKRLSKMIVDKPAEKPKPAEENQSPFGPRKLKPVSVKSPTTKDKDMTEAPARPPLKPSDNIANSDRKSDPSTQKDSDKSVAKQPDNVTKPPDNVTKQPDSVAKQPDNVAKRPPSDVEVKRLSQQSDSGTETQSKPAVIPRPSGLNKPPPPMRPKPPVGSKPTPAPRRSINSESGEQDENDSKTPANNDTNSAQSEIVYDSATLKMSVKDKISKFGRNSGGSTKGENSTTVETKGENSTTQDATQTKGDKKEDSKINPLLKELKQQPDTSISKDSPLRDSNKSNNSEACDLDPRTEDNPEMTDSGIVQDAERPTGKAGSLPRSTRPSDMEKDNTDTPKRPKSMMAVLGNHPNLMQRDELSPKTKPTIPENDEKEKQDSKRDSTSSNEEKVILV